ncbi:MAG: transglycosylase domain-containing protein [Flavipsychrobacter sp.]
MRKILSLFAYLLYKDDVIRLKKQIRLIYSSINNSKRNKYKLFAQLLISGEDHRFRYHWGFDPIAIIRAIKQRLLHNRIEGASTIEQQLVRVMTNNYKICYKRKIKEILLSTTIKSFIPKKDIPYVYLEVAYYGDNVYGLHNMLEYLKLKEENITIEKSAELIAFIKYPYCSKKVLNNTYRLTNRKNHLLNLYKKHLNTRIFKLYYEY